MARVDGDNPARLPRPVALVILAAIVGATLASLIRPQFDPTMLPAASTGSLDVRAGVGVIVRQVDAPDRSSRIGGLAPEFEWTTADGRTLRVGDLRVSVVVVNFWATWCVPCRTELPLLDALARDDGDVTVLAVDLQEDAAAVRAYFDRYGLTAITPLIDPNADTFRRWSVFTLPTTYFVDHTGRIQHLAVGAMTEDALRDGIRRARSV